METNDTIQFVSAYLLWLLLLFDGLHELFCHTICCFNRLYWDSMQCNSAADIAQLKLYKKLNEWTRWIQFIYFGLNWILLVDKWNHTKSIKYN